jgi:hypothetical protein
LKCEKTDEKGINSKNDAAVFKNLPRERKSPSKRRSSGLVGFEIKKNAINKNDVLMSIESNSNDSFGKKIIEVDELSSQIGDLGEI